ncbi:transposase [Lysinibacillus sp. KU-BSD001]
MIEIKNLVDFAFNLEELKTKYCLDNGRNTIPLIRMFKYLLLKALFNMSDSDIVERSKNLGKRRYNIEAKHSKMKNPHGYTIRPNL